ncbi:MAG: hypothetical protein R2854_05060 [Caldilineaceae bacterium]
MYGDVNPWYGATFTETQRLYAIDATRVYTTETPVPTVNVTACDSYGHCTTVATDVHNETRATLGTLLQSPLPGDVVSVAPIPSTQRPSCGRGRRGAAGGEDRWVDAFSRDPAGRDARG